MLSEQFSLHDDFPPVSFAEWRAVAERDLNGAPFEKKLITHTYEEIDVQPVYTQSDYSEHAELPGFPPFTRGACPLGSVLSGWDLRPEHAHPSLEISSQEILADLEGGARSLLLRFDLAARNGLDPDESAAQNLAGTDGIMAYCLQDVQRLLADVRLEVTAIQLQAGAAFLPAAAALVAIWRQRDVPKHQAQGAFAADPLAALAEQGSLPVSVDTALTMMANLAVWTAEHYPHVTAVGVDTSVYHHAGATAAQDIAFGLATATDYLRAVTGAGLDIQSAARQFLFDFSIGTHHFLAIAKLRAARRLWSHVIEACGGAPESRAMRIRARTSQRVLTHRDPYVNLLRNTAAMFAACLGGAETITSVPFDNLNGPPDEFGRRIARNTVLILQEEGHLHRVVDPAGGSWFLEKLTEQIAEKAWDIFQDVERLGGMRAALESGWVAQEIESAYAPREQDIARRKDGITGVSEFPDVAEEPIVREVPDVATLRDIAVERIVSARQEVAALPSLQAFNDIVAAASRGASFGQMARALGFQQDAATMPPLKIQSFAGPFEMLRDASDAWQQEHGSRPRVFLAPMGPVTHYTPRLTYAKNFFGAGGFETIVGEDLDTADDAAVSFANSNARIAVICSSDELYPELVPQVAPQLRAAGARTVVLAGNPLDKEDPWRSAGVDRFIFINCDVLATLRELLEEEGVLGR